MRHPTQYVKRAIDGLRGYLRTSMPVVVFNGFVGEGTARRRYKFTITACVLSHDMSDGITQADVDSRDVTVSIRIQRNVEGGWPLAAPPGIGDTYTINGVQFVSQRVEEWPLGWKVRATKSVEAPQ